MRCAAPKRGEHPAGARGRPAHAIGSGPPLTMHKSRGADKGQMRTHLSRPSDGPQLGGRVAPGPDPRSGKAWCRAALAEASRPAWTCPRACPQGLPERSEGPQWTGALAPEYRVGRPAREARYAPRKPGFILARRAIYRPKARTPEATAQR